MLHFPSKLQSNGSSTPRRSTDLNATQHKSSSHPIFSQIEEELHDARRVYSHGQEEDLRSALNMVIDRVVLLVSSPPLCFSCFAIDAFYKISY
jgi:uncharacterized protein YbbK (DUF523 family)